LVLCNTNRKRTEEARMKTIVVPLDGSALAEQVLPYARVLATIMSADIRLLLVISEVDRYNLLVQEPAIVESFENATAQRARDPNSWAVLRQQAEAYLEVQAAPLREAGLDATIDVRLGTPALAIVNAADQCHAQMIVMATHGYSGLQRWALGSVADKVVQATTAPVMIVRGKQGPPAADVAIKRLLVPLDGSALARQALPQAVELAVLARAEMVLLNVVVPPLATAPELMTSYERFDDVLPAIRERLMDELGDLATRLDQQQVTVTPVAAEGFVAETIVDEAAHRGVDLIVMATHGYSGVRRWALGSVADKVLHTTTAPLLLVHVQERPGAIIEGATTLSDRA
jgi:nucleotide-binding universal stress UspA family protein